MSVPGIVQSTLDGEEIAARVSLGSEDELFITPTSTLVYRSDGLLRDESVDEYPHEADRITLSEGRRKSKFTLEYPLEGTQEFTVPSGKTDAVLHPVLAGVLNGNGITEAGETVVQTYRFSELTLIITSERLVKHIGSAVWDEDYEEYHFDDVTRLSFEDGSVAMQIVLMVDGRPQRIKAPNEEANDLRERLKRALFDYHDVSSLEELNEKLDDGESDADEDAGSTMEFGSGVDPLDADPPEPDDHEIEGAANADRSVPAESAADSAVPESADARRTQADEEEKQRHARARDQESSGPTPRDTAGSQSQSEPELESEPRDRARKQERERERDVSDSKPEPEPEPDSDPEPVETGSLFEESADSSADTPAAADTAASARSDPLSPDGPETTATEPEGETGSGSGSQSHAHSNSQSQSQSARVRSESDSSADSDAVAGTTDPELLERIESLEDVVERQNDLLERQQQTIDQLIEELRQGR